jgi:hypothetical protein
VVAKFRKLFSTTAKILGKIGIRCSNSNTCEKFGKNWNTCENFGKKWNTCEKFGKNLITWENKVFGIKNNFFFNCLAPHKIPQKSTKILIIVEIPSKILIIPSCLLKNQKSYRVSTPLFFFYSL